MATLIQMEKKLEGINAKIEKLSALIKEAREAKAALVPLIKEAKLVAKANSKKTVPIGSKGKPAS